MIPGEYRLQDGEIALCEGRERITLEVANIGDRPVQIGSHYHFAEANPALVFDRDLARGRRLDVAAGTAIRFEPGQSREVTLIPFVGHRRIYGFRGDVMGELSIAPEAERNASPAPDDARTRSTAPEAARPSSSGDADQGESS
ncbi:hypothetical protein HHA04nite_10980 [Halomonas halophila]|uniref:Urease subunit beta n=1 Tax=Halomonas halophila TaxID=29573 RepID=A0ABQ0U1Y9_9GAMM|nr:hypothetical protein HHA04nite_10980 [Halomonas halophila]